KCNYRHRSSAHGNSDRCQSPGVFVSDSLTRPPVLQRSVAIRIAPVGPSGDLAGGSVLGSYVLCGKCTPSRSERTRTNRPAGPSLASRVAEWPSDRVASGEWRVASGGTACQPPLLQRYGHTRRVSRSDVRQLGRPPATRSYAAATAAMNAASF